MGDADWWMLHLLGYEEVSILNGGFDAWLVGLPVDRDTTVFPSAELPVSPSPAYRWTRRRSEGCRDDISSTR